MKTNNLIQAGIIFLSLTYSAITFAQSVHTQVYDAQTAIAKQDWLTAETILSQANQANPNNPYVLYEMAQVYENTNRLGSAAKIYQDFSKLPEAQLREYVVVVRSADGIETTNLANITPTNLDRITAKQASVKPAAPQIVSAPPTAAPPALVVDAPKVAAIEPVQQKAANEQSLDNAVMLAVQQWATSWANKDLPAYFASYVQNFQGNQPSRAAWIKIRQSNIVSKKLIELDLSDIQITTLSPTKAQINFELKYSADKLKETSNKSLLMTKVNNTWLIEKEGVK